MENEESPSNFEVLVDLAMESQITLEKLYNDNNVSVLCTVAKELLGNDFNLRISSPQEFILSVYGLRDLNGRLSRRLGEAMILSDELYEKGEVDEAMRVMADFIEHCPSEFLNESAKVCYESYKSGTHKVGSEDSKKWGKMAGNVIIDAYELYEQGNFDEALKVVDEFLEVCPENGFRDDVTSMREDIEKRELKIFKRWADREN